MSANEVSLAAKYLANALNSNIALMAVAIGGAWRDLAPPGLQTPYIVFAHQAGTDTMAFRKRAYSSMVWQVKIIGPAAISQTLESGSALMDDAIAIVNPVSVTGGEIKTCFRQQPLLVSEIVNGELWNNVGGLYRVMASQT